ncbi:MAG: uracil-DNA glycosylase, partial [Variovorax sp.]|nr:uracil-DNA glycosylase [Variovorax sp.]
MTPRHRAMLDEMGIKLFWWPKDAPADAPAMPEPPDAVAEADAAEAPAARAPVAAARPAAPV